MSLQGRVGVYDEEHLTGAQLIIDVRVKVPVRDAGITDTLSDAFDYGIISNAVQDAFKSKFHLLEAAARKIAENILAKSKVEIIDVRIQKLNPPLQLPVVASEVWWSYPEDY